MHISLRRFIGSIALISSCASLRADDSPQWLTYPGGDGPGKGKRVVLIAADQEYRSEQSMPMSEGGVAKSMILRDAFAIGARAVCGQAAFQSLAIHFLP
jgi:hypothetical protein